MSIFPPALYAMAEALLTDLAVRDLRLATAESCTGGLVVALLTEIPGSSRVVDRGFVTYSNASKSDAIDVDPVLIMAHGAVSREVAIAMAEGALEHSDADIAVAITGIAGPDGGTDAKPVGLVHLAAAGRDTETIAKERRFGNQSREAIRLAAVEEALGLLQSIAATVDT